MLGSGVYPAAVTPFLPTGDVDSVSFARLLAFFEAAGCAGVVVGGTNGEGPSLSAVERRDLCRDAVRFAGKLTIIQGIASSALPEAVWLAQQAGKAGAVACLVMPPSYFRHVSVTALRDWFLHLMDRSTIPVLVYHFPKMTGIDVLPEVIETLQHERFAGIKDSSGNADNLPRLRAALNEDQALFVGEERLLVDALDHGWTGAISGVANVLPQWLSRLVFELTDPALRDSGLAKATLLRPLIDQIRAAEQPASHKALLCSWRILSHPDVRLPLTATQDADALADLIRARLGIHADELALPLP